MRRILEGIFSGLMLVMLTAAPSQAQMAKGASLYERLGGKRAIVAVVDEFVGRVAADNRINGFFKETASDPNRLAAFKGKLVDQICEASGGPCKYTGKDMKSAHQGMGISRSRFQCPG